MQLKFLEKSIFLHSGPVGGPWNRGSFTGDFETIVTYCFIKRTFLLEAPGDTQKQARETGISLYVGSLRQLEGAHLPRTLSER
jgi:hypothetical protein